MTDQNAIDNALSSAKKAVDDIQSRKLSILEKHGCTFEKIVKELKACAFSNQKDYFDVAEGGELCFKAFKGKGSISRVKASAIKKIREKTVITESKDGENIYKTSTIELELYDKPNTLWRLIELRGDKPAEKQEHIGNVTVTIVDYSKAGENA